MGACCRDSAGPRQHWPGLQGVVASMRMGLPVLCCKTLHLVCHHGHDRSQRHIAMASYHTSGVYVQASCWTARLRQHLRCDVCVHVVSVFGCCLCSPDAASWCCCCCCC